MPSKEKVVVGLNKGSYSKQEVVSLINSITHIEAQKDFIKKESRKPSYLMRGDIYWNDMGGGKNTDDTKKKRPCVIIKVVDDVVLSIPLTRTENGLAFAKSSFRFGDDGFFTRQIVTVPIEYAMRNFYGVYGNEKKLRKVIRDLKQYLNNTI